MLSDIASSEYSPLRGSAGNPDKQRAFMAGGAAALLCLGLFAFSGGSSHQVQRLNNVQTQVAAVQAQVAQVPVTHAAEPAQTAAVPAQTAAVPAQTEQPAKQEAAVPAAEDKPVDAPAKEEADAAPAEITEKPVTAQAETTPAAADSKAAAPAKEEAAAEPVKEAAAPAEAEAEQPATKVEQTQSLPATDVQAPPAPPKMDAAPKSHETVATESVEFTSTQYDLVYNILSFAIACMGSATVFFFFQFSLVDKQYRTAMVITSLVTLIAFYHYIRIFNSFTDAYSDDNGKITATGVPFNDAYRYVDWLLTVPLLLMELILVMNLEPEETRDNCLKLGGAAALMIVLGYPGEVSASMSTRWLFWALAMLPFLYIVYTLFVGLSDSVAEQPERARGLVDAARWVTVLSWCTYPVVYILPMLGVSGAAARTGIQLGYSIADVIAKPLLGLVVWQIAKRKSKGGDR